MGERRGAGMLAALAPVTLLAVDPAGWFPFGPVKWLAVSTMVLGGTALIAATRPLRAPRPLVIALGALLASLVVAAAVGLDPLYAWTGTPERHLGVVAWGLFALCLLAGCSLDGHRELGLIAAGLAVAGFGVGLVATVEALGWEPTVLDAGDRLTGTLGSAAYLGAAVALLLPVVLGVALDRTLPRWVRSVGTAGAPLLVVAAVGSGARAAWVGLAVGALAVTIPRRGWLRRRPRATAGGLGAAAVSLVLIALVTPAGARLGALTDGDAAGGRGRLDEWRVAIVVIAEHPVTGVGPEGYRIAFAEGVDARYERAHGRLQQPDRAHAAPLDLALSGGIPALVAWLAVVLLVGRSALVVLRHASGWIVGAAVGLVAHVVGQLLLFPTVELEPIAWLLGGVVVSAAARRAGSGVRLDRAMPGARWPALLLGVLTAVAVVAGVTDVVADRRAGEAVDALERGDTATAARHARAARDLRPDVVRLRVLAATAFVADEQGLLAGIAELEAGLEVSPGDPILLLRRATLLVDRAEATLVPAHLDAAQDDVDLRLATDPYNSALWRLAARVAALDGDAAAAAAASARADDLTPIDQRRP